MPLDPIQQAAFSCGAHLEHSKVKPNEVPIVIAYLVIALSDLTHLPPKTVVRMVETAVTTISRAKATSKN